jgi:radical SAM protein with 4Fe4S-binding SPASM domain
MFSRVYLEITNVCNRSCRFCPGTARPAKMLTPQEFRLLAGRLRPYSDYLYLHVMGEPLLHPQLPELLAIAGELGFRVMLTTNGTLLPARQDELLAAPALCKLSVSLHSFEANEERDFAGYLAGCAAFGRAAMGRTLVSYRLWNLDSSAGPGANARNGEILAALEAAFPQPWVKNSWGWRLADGVFLHYGELFDWPDPAARDRGERGFCRALTDQVAVLSDGTVVPCCLDRDGRLALGNLYEQELSDILASPGACEIREGFAARRRARELCRRCGYSERFG